MVATILSSVRKLFSARPQQQRTRLDLETLERRDCPSTTAAPYLLTSNGNLYRNNTSQSTLVDTNVKSYQYSSANGCLVDLHTNGDLNCTFNNGGSWRTLERLVTSYTLNAAGTNVSFTDWFSSNVQDTGMRNLARADYLSDASISRSEMIGLLNQAGSTGIVTSTAFRDLQTIVANPTTLRMPTYVQYLADQVVNGDFANAHYQGGSLGNLYAGSASWRLTQLVNKWFLGMDHPLESSTAPQMPYAPVYGSLFSASGPSYVDVKQGNLGDCTVLASMAEVAYRGNSTIQNMFISNGDGTWTVRFYKNASPVYVTVDNQLPGGGNLYDHPNSNLWVALAEKAYAQLNEEGWLGTLRAGVNSYGALDGGNSQTMATALMALTGKSAIVSANPNSVAVALQTGKFVVLGTNNQTTNSAVEHNHAYAFLSYNPNSSYPFTAFNPWGINGGTDENGHAIWGKFSCNAAFLAANFVSGAIAGAGVSSMEVSPASAGLGSHPVDGLAYTLSYLGQAKVESLSFTTTQTSPAFHADSVFSAFGLQTHGVESVSYAGLSASHDQASQGESSLPGSDGFFGLGGFGSEGEV